MSRWCLVVLLVLCAAVPAAAVSMDPVYVSSLGGGVVYATALQGDYAYCAGDECFAIYDISDSNNPQLVGSADTPPYASNVAVSGSYAFVGTGEGVLAFDVSDPTHPVEVGAYEVPWGAAVVGVGAGELYVVDGTTPAFMVLDVSNPAAMALLGSAALTAGGAPTGLVSGDYLYLVAGGYLETIDISDPAHPTIRGSLASVYDAKDVAQVGSYLYLPAAGNGVRIVSLADPAAPALVATLSTGSLCPIVAAAVGNVLYVAAYGPVLAYDVSSPTAPSLLATGNSGGFTADVTAFEGKLYLSSVVSGLLVADTAAPSYFTVVGASSGVTGPTALGTVKGYLYAASYNLLSVVDVSEAAAPQVVHAEQLAFAAQRIVAVDNYAYVAAGHKGLQVMDVSDPVHPVVLGAGVGESMSVDFTDVAIWKPFAYVADAGQGMLRVYDVSDPASPTQVSTVPGSFSSLAIANSKLYAAGGSGLYVISLASPYTPSVMGRYEAWSFGGEVPTLAVTGDRAWASDPYGWVILDVSNLASIQQVATLWSGEPWEDAARPYGATLVDGLFYLANGSAGVKVYDASVTDTTPPQVGAYQTWGLARAITSDRDFIYVGDYAGRGATVLRAAPAFTDVPWGAWGYEAIRSLYRVDIVKGFPDGSYQPKQEVTRGQMAAYIARAMCGGDARVPTGPATATFPDVPVGSSFFRYVEYAHEQGVVAGYKDGSYQPTWAVNRGQMAAFLARAVAGGEAYVPTGPATPSFSDVATSYGFYNHVEYIYAQGITTGYGDGTFHPEYGCARDQMAVFVARAFYLLP